MVDHVAFGIQTSFWESIGLFLLGAGVIIGVVLGVVALIFGIKTYRSNKPSRKVLLILLCVVALLFISGPFAWNAYYAYQDKQNKIVSQKYQQNILQNLSFRPLKPTMLPQVLSDAEVNVSLIDENNLVLSPNGEIALSFYYRKSKTPGDVFNVIADVNLVEFGKPNVELTDGICPEDRRRYAAYYKDKLLCKVIGTKPTGEKILLVDNQDFELRRQLDYFVDIGDTRVIITYGYYTNSKDKRVIEDSDVLELINGLMLVDKSEIDLSKD